MEGKRVPAILVIGDTGTVEAFCIIDRDPPSPVGIGCILRGHLEGEFSDFPDTAAVTDPIDCGNLIPGSQDAGQIVPCNLLEALQGQSLSVDTELHAHRILRIAVHIQLGAVVHPEGEVGNVAQTAIVDRRGGHLPEGPDIVIGAKVMNDHPPWGKLARIGDVGEVDQSIPLVHDTADPCLRDRHLTHALLENHPLGVVLEDQAVELAAVVQDEGVGCQTAVGQIDGP